MHASGSAPSALVGRDRELTLLRERLTTALAGSGSLVLIGGEAGIGKTALAEALCREAADTSALVLIGRCYDLSETPPYGPWVELLDHDLPGGGPPLPVAFAQHGSVGAVTSRAMLFQQVLDFFRGLARRHTVVLLLEDLHWADTESLDLLRVVSRNLAALPLLLAVTYRADELTRRHQLYQLLPALVRESGARRLDLQPLDADAVRALVSDRYAIPNADTGRLVAYLDARAEGNALFIEELLRSLEETGVLRQDGGRWVLDALMHAPVPPLLRAVIDARVARLGAESQRLLGVAAVIGQEVPFDLWATVAETAEDGLLLAVEEATAARLIAGTPVVSGIRFMHALIREALYEGVSPLRRRSYHRRTGAALAAQPRPDADAIAAHFQRAGDARAAAWLIRAGERAEGAYALGTASERYEAALALLPDDPTAERGWLLYRAARIRFPRATDYLDEALRCAEATDDRALAAVARYFRGYTRCQHGERREGVEELMTGADAIMALSPAERGRLEALPGQLWPEKRVPHGTAIIWSAMTGRYAQVLALAERWILPAPLLPAAQGEAWAGLAYTHAALGRPDEAWAAFANARAGFEQTGNHIMLAAFLGEALKALVLPYAADRIDERRRIVATIEAATQRFSVAHRETRRGMLGRLTPAFLSFVEGRWDDPRFALAEAIASGEEPVLNLVVPENAHGLLAALYRAQGRYGEAWAQVRALLPLGPASEAEETYRPLHTYEIQRLAAGLALDEDDLAVAKAWLEADGRWRDWSGAVLGRSEAAALWARYHRQSGDRKHAHLCAQSALDHATSPRQPLALLAAHRLLGELAADSGRYDDAAHHFSASITLADACAAPYERALTLLALAELRAATGDEAGAAAALDEARAICTPLGAKPALARADALAARLSVQPVRVLQHPGGLSAREVQVLCLVAQGMTDVQVAEHLFLSPRTVGQHLRNIYNKLGVSTRNAAARFAIEHHLT